MPADVTTMATRISDLIQVVRDLTAAVNGLRQDFRAHDHGTTYAASRIRLNAAPVATWQGSAAASVGVTNLATEAQAEAMWDELFRALGASQALIERPKRF